MSDLATSTDACVGQDKLAAPAAPAADSGTPEASGAHVETSVPEPLVPFDEEAMKKGLEEVVERVLRQQSVQSDVTVTEYDLKTAFENDPFVKAARKSVEGNDRADTAKTAMVRQHRAAVGKLRGSKSVNEQAELKAWRKRTKAAMDRIDKLVADWTRLQVEAENAKSKEDAKAMRKLKAEAAADEKKQPVPPEALVQTAALQEEQKPADNSPKPAIQHEESDEDSDEYHHNWNKETKDAVSKGMTKGVKKGVKIVVDRVTEGKAATVKAGAAAAGNAAKTTTVGSAAASNTGKATTVGNVAAGNTGKTTTIAEAGHAVSTAAKRPKTVPLEVYLRDGVESALEAQGHQGQQKAAAAAAAAQQMQPIPAAPVVAAPVPVMSAPSAPVSVVSAPATVVSAPVVSAPAVSASVVSAPVVNVPAVSAPVVSAPVISAPVVSAPVVSAPVVSAPVVSAPVVSAPAVSAPVVSAPAATAPVVTAPVVSAVPTASAGSGFPSAIVDLPDVQQQSVSMATAATQGASVAQPVAPQQAVQPQPAQPQQPQQPQQQQQQGNVFAAAGISAGVLGGAISLRRQFEDQEKSRVEEGHNNPTEAKILVPVMQDAAIAAGTASGTAWAIAQAAEHPAFAQATTFAAPGIAGIFAAGGVLAALHSWSDGKMNTRDFKKNVTKIGIGASSSLACLFVATTSILPLTALAMGTIFCDLTGITDAFVSKLYGKDARTLRVELIKCYAAILDTAATSSDDAAREQYKALADVIEKHGTESDRELLDQACVRLLLLRNEARGLVKVDQQDLVGMPSHCKQQQQQRGEGEMVLLDLEGSPVKTAEGLPLVVPQQPVPAAPAAGGSWFSKWWPSTAFLKGSKPVKTEVQPAT
ncbi:Repetitive proline-rich cell wall protein 1 [Diplonema papillatum]|nr:Repetitive proline-rich cell wall protein 1 [Diplonema papillatum]